MQISTPTSDLKCPTCKVFFVSDQLHKQHYKSDFHRYNLKRSMVNLPPATLQQFSTKRSEVKNQKEITYQCNECRKTFNSSQTLNQHAQSKKHNISMIRQPQPEKLIEQKPKVYVKNQKVCLFCAKQFETLDLSLDHMRRDHSFFIPQQNYCVDKAKLILYLQQKVQVGMLCIFCDNKGTKDFATGEAVRNHMVSKNHTFMNTQKGYEEYQDHYDFSSLFNQKLEEQKFYSTPLGINFQKVKVIVDELKEVQKKIKKQKAEDKIVDQKAQGDGQWDDVQSDEQESNEQWQDQSEDQETNVIQQEKQGQNDNQGQIQEKKKRKIKTYQIMVPTLTSNDELLLPNGKMLGHRKYRHIYKQAVKINNWFENNNMKMLDTGANQQALALRNELLDLIKKDRYLKTLSRIEDKKYVKSGIQNSNLFRHFRSSNPL